ncbi:tail fiber protein [Undibacterium sp. CY18W]|uniref:Tail fiber protein n=1 Tax=Undibacterium hunanense TaxID=2762292 RepID=A0ABR6ZZ04_9BURK|nr:tail fiber protein [Undibacterium hunanense]MBC3920979.1 tail fiber protein [Undibacterium hunanense]
MDAFMGTILAVGFNFPPRGWLFCNGQTVSIAQNSAMFALLGTMYGGDGQATFGIPDLRGRVAVGSQGAGPGIANVSQGEKAGVNNVTAIATGTGSVTLTVGNLPPHTHVATLDLTGVSGNTTVNVGTGTNGGVAAVTNNGGLTSTATGSGLAAAVYLPAGTAPTAPVALGGVTTALQGTGTVTNANTGSGTPTAFPVTTTSTNTVMQPYLGLNYIIAMEGIFPSRN